MVITIFIGCDFFHDSKATKFQTHGLVVDPYISEARFYADTNSNGKFDSNELLSGESGINGIFVFDTEVPTGISIRMHPDYKGRHNGEEYTGELLERKVEGAIEDNIFVISPISTLNNVYGVSYEDIKQIIDEGFEEADYFPLDSMEKDPMEFLSTGDISDEKINILRANIAVNSVLNLLNRKSSLKEEYKALGTEDKKQKFAACIKPFCGNMTDLVSLANHELLNSTFSDQVGSPGLTDFNNVIRSGVRINDYMIDTIGNELDTFTIDNLNSLISSQFDIQADTIAENKRKTLFSYVIKENYNELVVKDILDNVIQKSDQAIPGENLSEFFSKIDPDFEIDIEEIITGIDVSIVANDDDYGIVSGNGRYSAEVTISATATPKTGYRFVEWTGDTDSITSGNENTADIDIYTGKSDISLTADFEIDLAQTFTLTVNSGANGSASDDTGTGPYNVEETVNISATADTGYRFFRWTGDTAGIDNVNSANTTITMPGSNVTIQADFVVDTGTTYTLTVNTGANGSAADDTG
ncbi:MAG: InlB B-repeat-containing protein, partial [Candidatus Muiribacteriaceae bacterium]